MKSPAKLGIVIGLLALLLVSVVLATTVFKPEPPPAPATAPIPVSVSQINCYGGSEKVDLMNDPEIKQIQLDKYQLTVNFTGKGSIEQALIPTEQLKSAKINCLMPSSAAAQLVFENRHKVSSDFPGYRQETVLISPEVIYSGPETTDALIRANIVQKREDKYFIIDQKRLTLDLTLKGATWDMLQTPTIRGPIFIRTSDPAKSNSAFTEYLVVLTIAATSDPYKAPTAAQALAVLPQIRALYEAQGLQSRSSGFGFDEWVLQGGETSAPLYAGYENQILDKVARNPGQVQKLLKDVRMLYQEPTFYNDHVILALDADAQRLIEAMKDPRIQEIAWKKYGFRSTQLGVTNISDFPDVPLSDRVQVAALPNAEVILMLNDCLLDRAKCSTQATQ